VALRQKHLEAPGDLVQKKEVSNNKDHIYDYEAESNAMNTTFHTISM